MKEPRFSPLAIEDLNGILEYIARDNPTAAVAFVTLLEEKCEFLARFPLLGEARSELAEGIRAFSVAIFSVLTHFKRVSGRLVQSPDGVFGKDNVRPRS